MRFSVMAKARLGIGTRTIVKMLEVINEVFGDLLGELPCANTIDLWTSKCGLGTYKQNALDLRGQKYCQIVDEHMAIGNNRLVLTLATPASHPGRPLLHSDAAVVGIDVAGRFDAERISEAMEKAAKAIGSPPEYVVTDNASPMKKAVSDVGFRHHLDLSHSLALTMEHTYKEEEDFKAYCKKMSLCQFQNNMRPVTYLLPPKQRTVARFLNISSWVKWSRKMLDVWLMLTSEERETFSFVLANASLVEELHEAVSCVRFIEETCKGKGVSKKTVKDCVAHINKTLSHGTERMRKLADEIIRYMESEVSWMQDGDVHNCSSDILESTFGIFKARKSPNALYGVTTLVLHLPVFEKLADMESACKYDIAAKLEKTRVRDIKQWERENLTPSLVAKRLNVLGKAACF